MKMQLYHTYKVTDAGLHDVLHELDHHPTDQLVNPAHS